MTERSRLRLGMDAFNFFNHTNLTGLVTSINNAFFGQLQSTGRRAADSVEWTIELVARCKKAGPGSHDGGSPKPRALQHRHAQHDMPVKVR